MLLVLLLPFSSILLQHQQQVWVYADRVADNDPQSFSTSSSSCPSYGCPMFPLDIINNNNNNNDGVDVQKALQDEHSFVDTLRSCGDTSKVTFTLMGSKGGPTDINQDAAVIHSPFHILFPTTMTKEDNGKNDDDNDDKTIHDIHLQRLRQRIQLIGVFDGHGTSGELTSNFASKEIPQRLSERFATMIQSSSSIIDETTLLSYLSSSESSPSSSTDEFYDEIIQSILSDNGIDDDIIIGTFKEVFLEVDQDDPSKGVGGCTATMVLQLGSKLYVANVGDSVSFVSIAYQQQEQQPDHQNQNRPWMVDVVYQTREDKPDLPDERERIVKAGGYVHIPHSDHDVPRAYYIDKFGKARYGLAMSRSLGDWSVQGVIADPIVDVIDLDQIRTSYLESCRLNNNDDDDSDNDNDKTNGRNCDTIDPNSIRFLAVSMSDGMADYLEVDDVGTTMALSFFHQQKERDSSSSSSSSSSRNHPHRHPLIAADYLIRKAAKIWDADYGGQYRDDIAIAAITL